MQNKFSILDLIESFLVSENLQVMHFVDFYRFQVYMSGQEEQHHYGEQDYEFCGTSLPQEVKTPGPRLVLLFSSGNKPAQGFKAKFTFETGSYYDCR